MTNFSFEASRHQPGRKLPSWRWEALRTTFWMAPTVMVLIAGVLFRSDPRDRLGGL